ncbi:hypothetical protein CG719_31900 [Streptomyces sp. CB01373]|nr:hypothetical protein CG719_31900 [Streptomyces sp. CB01373]
MPDSTYFDREGLSDGQLAPREVHVLPAHVPRLDADLWTASLYAVSFLPVQLHAHYFNLLVSGSGLTLRRSGGVLGEERLPFGDPGLPYRDASGCGADDSTTDCDSCFRVHACSLDCWHRASP